LSSTQPQMTENKDKAASTWFPKATSSNKWATQRHWSDPEVNNGGRRRSNTPKVLRRIRTDCQHYANSELTSVLLDPSRTQHWILLI